MNNGSEGRPLDFLQMKDLKQQRPAASKKQRYRIQKIVLNPRTWGCEVLNSTSSSISVEGQDPPQAGGLQSPSVKRAERNLWETKTL